MYFSILFQSLGLTKIYREKKKAHLDKHILTMIIARSSELLLSTYLKRNILENNRDCLNTMIENHQ